MLPLPERMSEQFKMENDARMKLDVLENVMILQTAVLALIVF